MPPNTLSKLELRRQQQLKDISISYAYNIKRLKIAHDHGFYLEALLIEYALIEDRVYSLLFHLGLFNFRQELLESKKRLVKVIMNSEQSPMRLMEINTRLNLLKRICDFDTSLLEEHERNFIDSIRLFFIKKNICQELLILVEEISSWCSKRNRLVHRLVREYKKGEKDYLPGIINEGLLLMRRLDNIVSKIKGSL